MTNEGWARVRNPRTKRLTKYHYWRDNYTLCRGYHFTPMMKGFVKRLKNHEACKKCLRLVG